MVLRRSLPWRETQLRRGAGEGWLRSDKRFSGVAEQLKEYFAGERRQFDLNLALRGTEFQLAVLAALQRIPFGETRSYLEIAQEISQIVENNDSSLGRVAHE